MENQLPATSRDGHLVEFRKAVVDLVPPAFLRYADLREEPTTSSGFLVRWTARVVRWHFSRVTAPCRQGTRPMFPRWESGDFITNFDMDAALEARDARQAVAIDDTIKERTCISCSGKGTHRCKSCDGKKNVSEHTTCEACGGTGQRGRGTCRACDGAGSQLRETECQNCDLDGTVECEECRGLGLVAEFATAELDSENLDCSRVCHDTGPWVRREALEPWPQGLKDVPLEEASAPVRASIEEWVKSRQAAFVESAESEFRQCFGGAPIDSDRLVRGRIRSIRMWPVTIRTYRWRYTVQRLSFGLKVVPSGKVVDGAVDVITVPDGAQINTCWSRRPRRTFPFLWVTFERP